MITGIKVIPLAFAGFSASILVAQTPDIPVTTAAGALIAGFTLLLGTLCWIVKKQLETFPASLKDQQATFTAALDKQGMVFATVIDKIRDDNQKTLKTLKMLKDEEDK